MAERKDREGGDSRGDKGYGKKTTGRTIRDQDDRRKWEEKGHQRLTVKSEFIYSNDRVVTSTDPGWLQSALNFLTGLFDWVGLQTNIRKTVGMVCWPCWEAGVRAYEAYKHRMAGEGRRFKEQQREWVSCPE